MGHGSIINQTLYKEIAKSNKPEVRDRCERSFSSKVDFELVEALVFEESHLH